MKAFNNFTEEQVKRATAPMGGEFEPIESEDFDDEEDDSDIEDEAPAKKKNFDIGDILG